MFDALRKVRISNSQKKGIFSSAGATNLSTEARGTYSGKLVNAPFTS